MVNVHFNTDEIASYKRKLNHQLEPIKVMLVNRKSEMLKDEWLDFTERTRKSILDHPDQYLDKNFPETSVLQYIVNKIFDDFIHQMKAG